jgi:hypothetical protein
MGLFSLLTGDMTPFKPPKPPKPESYAPPPPVYVPPPPPPSVTQQQQAPALNAVTPLSPILASTQKNVLESPATGLPDLDELKKQSRASGGFAV